MPLTLCSPQRSSHACGRPPSVTAAAGKRTGHAGGFAEFDRAEEEDRRKRRAVEDRQQVAERKAERTKCVYCKRFSCIC